MNVQKFVRQVIDLGTSLAVTLPAEYVKKYNINKGDSIVLMCDKSVFIGVPIKEHVEAYKIIKKLQEVKE